MKKVIKEIADKEKFKNFIIFLIGLIILAINYNLFVLPNEFNIGGMTGIATMLNYLCKIKPSYFIFGSSVFLLILSYFTLDKNTTYNSIIGAILYPLLIDFVKPLCDVIAPFLNFSNIVILIIIAGVLLGIGNGLVYKSGFTLGGSDIIMKIIHKYQHLTEGNSQLLMNTVIVLLGILVFGIPSAIYSLILLIISTNIVDKIIIGISTSKMFLITSKKYRKIQDYAINQMQTGVTILDTTGGFMFEKRKMLQIVVPTRSYNAFREKILEIDPNAFIVVNDCYEVTGGKKNKKQSLLQ